MSLGGDSKYFKETNTGKFDEITKQLDSNNFRDKLVGMKKVIAVSVVCFCVDVGVYIWFESSHPINTVDNWQST